MVMAKSPDEAESLVKDERVPIQFLNQNSLKRIEYPGYIKNIPKVIQTLGGEANINSKLKDPARRLELCLRPEDPYARKAYSDRFQASDLLMKVKRKRKKGEMEYTYECHIIGIIDTTLKFKGLVDFQYLAPTIPDFFDKLHGSEIVDIETPLHVPPPAFARLDHLSDYQFRTERRPQPTTDTDVKENGQTGSVNYRKPRPSKALTVGFNATTIPCEPNPEALKEMERFKNEGLDIAQKLFNTRPIWSKKAVSYHLGKKAIRIRSILPCVGYYWLGGPWGKLWTKFGYDPRKNPAAKIYQRLDFRLRNKKALRSIVLPPTLRNLHDSYHTGIQRLCMNTTGVVPTGLGNTIAHDVTSREMTSQDDEGAQVLPYVFHPSRLPPTRQIIYQLCDIHCAEAQKIITENDGKESVCDVNCGWLTPVSYERIRKVLSDILLELVEKQKSDTTNQAGNSNIGAIEDDIRMQDDIGEEEETFLDTLMDDDDVEAYDILGDDF